MSAITISHIVTLTFSSSPFTGESSRQINLATSGEVPPETNTDAMENAPGVEGNNDGAAGGA